MALKHLQSLVLRVAATAVDNVTGMDGKAGAMRSATAFLSYPRYHSPSLARNPRGTIQSGWSWPLAITATNRPGICQDQLASEIFGSACA